MKDLPTRIRALSPRRLELLERRLRQRRQAPAADENGRCAEDTAVEDQPLSFAQERIWVIERLQPDLPIYNLYVPTRFRGALDLFALQRALDEIVRRHQALRTIFPARDGWPVQCIQPAQPVEIRLIDLRGLAADAREAEASRLASEEALKVFDVTQGPLFRATLLRLEPENHILVLTTHHIVSDGWSIGILVRELGTLYAAFVAGSASPLPELMIQYAGFAARQRKGYAKGIFNSSLSYWLDHLADAPRLAELPRDHPRPAVQTFRGACQSFEVSPAVRDKLLELARGESATLFMTLLAAFSVLLVRLSGQKEIVIGTPIADRSEVDLESLIGLFLNLLPLSIKVRGNPGFREFLGHIRAITLAAYAHKDCPFEKVVQARQPQRDLGHNPIFQILFTLQNQPTLPDIEVDALESAATDANKASPRVTPGTARYDLALSMSNAQSGLIGAFEYSTDQFEQATILRWIDHFKILIAAIANNPDGRVWALPILNSHQPDGMHTSFKNEPIEAGEIGCVHEIFENTAARVPSMVAVEDGERKITYRELDQRANRLAHYLLAQGVDREERIGLYFPRSLDLIVASLAVLKAGAAYIPLSPEDPGRRLELLIDQIGISTVLAHDQSRPQLRSTHVRLLTLDGHQTGISYSGAAPPPGRATAKNLAYVICSSGSTGVPNAILVPHEGPARLARSMVRTFRLNSEDRVLQFFSPSFDAWMWDVLLAFSAGATLCIAPNAIRQSGLELTAYMRAQRISAATLLPSMLDALPSEPLPDLHTLIVGGESCSAGLVDRWGRGRRFYNVYGPTEAAVAATLALCRPDTGAPHLGAPVAGTSVYLLDCNLSQVPIGVIGELFIGGLGLAHGYLGRPALTAERFLPDLFGRSGGRMFRTGDRGRYRADGNLEFIGRVDDQIKLRGHRIERGEIAAVMKQHPHVREVEVVLRDPGEVNQRLVAYVALAEKAERRREQSLAEIRRFLTERLPNYMIPAVLTVLEELPRTTTGKVDAARLPPPETVMQARESRLAVPRNPVEEAIAQLWQQILKLNQVGMDENFFELGGHSLAASWLVSQVRRLFGVELSLQSFFKKPTIAAMAGLILERSGDTVVPAEATELPAKKVIEPPPATARSDSWEQILANLDTLSDANLNTLLSRLQAEPELDGAVIEVETKFAASTDANFDLGDAELALSSIDRMSDRDVDALLQTLTNVEPQIL